jgi:hypothetical protein
LYQENFVMNTGKSAMATIIEAAALTGPKSLKQLAGFKPNTHKPLSGTA